MFEMSTGRNPMPTHWRDWYKRGRFSRAIGRMAMPGWPSALLFGLVIVALWAALALVVISGATPLSRDQAIHTAWLALLAFGGLAFPTILLSFFPISHVPRPLIYFTGLAGPALLAGGALWLAESRWKITEFKTIMETMPFSSFLFGLNKRDPTPTIFAIQGIIAVLVIGVAVWRSRSFWRLLASFEERDRAAAEKT
jgi:hypothetical protein